MTTAFREFLHQQAEKHQAEVTGGKAIVEEWRTALTGLFDQLRTWLRDSDTEGLIEVQESEVEITEPNLGSYRVPRLDLRAFGKRIGIIPKARKTVGTATPPQKSAPQRAAGRVDITNELRRYVLYRFEEDGRDLWLIDDLESGPKLLDQDAFEKALMSYLQ